MIQLYQKIIHLNVLLLFLQNPYDKYYLRETARLASVSPMTAKRALAVLTKDRLVIGEKFKNYTLYRANMESPALKRLKSAYNLSFLEEKGFTEKVKDIVPGAISLTIFGSFAKGENDKSSDLDVVLISTASKKSEAGGRNAGIGGIKGKASTEAVLSELLGIDVSMQAFTPAEWKEQSRVNKAFYMDVITEGITLFGERPVVT